MLIFNKPRFFLFPKKKLQVVEGDDKVMILTMIVFLIRRWRIMSDYSSSFYNFRGLTIVYSLIAGNDELRSSTVSGN